MQGLTNEKKSMKKIIYVLIFLFYHTIYIQSWDRYQDKIYRYMDIEIDGGADSGGADGAEWWG